MIYLSAYLSIFVVFVMNIVRIHHMLELLVGFYLFFCGCYDIMFGKNRYYIFLYIQSIAFFIMAFGYVGIFDPNS